MLVMFIRICCSHAAPLIIALIGLLSAWRDDVHAGFAALARGDKEAALREFLASAEEGDPKAQFVLGQLYENGEGFVHDFAEAMNWYRRAADQESGEASFAIGALYERGRGVPTDEPEAEKWYRHARKLGYTEEEVTTVHVRWYPGPEPLYLEPPGADWLPWAITHGEIQRLSEAGLTGKLVMNGYGRHGRGLKSRAVVVMQRQVSETVRLPFPDNTSVLFVQREDAWQTLPPNPPTLPRSIFLSPQNERPDITILDVEMFGGGRIGGSAFGWKE